VQFAGVDATFTPVSSTRVDAVVPDAAGTGPVTIFGDQGVATSAGDFTVNAKIDSILPTSGPAGSTVLITGRGFGAVLDVQFNGVSTVFGLDATGTQITATVPDSATTGPITVVTFGSGSPSSSTFTVTPTINGFDPLSGPVGTSVTIMGTGLEGVTGVKFGSLSAAFSGASANAVGATVPAGAVTGQITVTAGSSSATSADSFTVTP
jgi:hypothetical protein